MSKVRKVFTAANQDPKVLGLSAADGAISRSARVCEAVSPHVLKLQLQRADLLESALDTYTVQELLTVLSE